MPMTFEPMRAYMKAHGISYYYLANQGIDPATLHRIRHDHAITTETLGRGLDRVPAGDRRQLTAARGAAFFVRGYILGQIVHFFNRTICTKYTGPR